MSRLPGQAVPASGDDKVCPFCRKGSRGKEHLIIVCRPVRKAWKFLGGAGHWVYGLADYDHRITAAVAARFSTAISILSQTFATGEPPTLEAAYKSIIQGALAPLTNALQRSLNCIDMLTDVRSLTTHSHWRTPHSNGGISAGLDCDKCPRSGAPGVYTALAPGGQKPTIGCSKPCLGLRTCAASRVNVPILTLTAAQIPSAWPVCEDAPLGLPLDAPPQHCNATWHTSQCAGCGNHFLTLAASKEKAAARHMA